MFESKIAVTVLISLTLHVMAMTVVTITAPEDLGLLKPYSRVNFLGPILTKTAFDIMLEKVHTSADPSHNYGHYLSDQRELEVAVPKEEIIPKDFPDYLEVDMDRQVMETLSDDKYIPELSGEEIGGVLDQARMPAGDHPGTEAGKRQVIYRPEPPRLMKGVYGAGETFLIRLNVTVGPEGNVKSVSPMTITGDPQVDLVAAKYVKSWMFETSGGDIVGDEDVEVEVRMDTGAE